MERRRFLGWMGRAPLMGALVTSGCSYGAGAANAANECTPRQRDILGPFYVPGAPARSTIAGPDEPGERLLIRGRVLRPDCKTPIAQAVLDVWQADATGEYHGKESDYRLRGVIRSDKEGRYELSTIRPGRYRLSGGLRPAHIHYTVSAPGFRPVTTQLYFEGDPYLGPKDACGDACASNDPERIISLKEEREDGRKILVGTFDVVLAT